MIYVLWRLAVNVGIATLLNIAAQKLLGFNGAEAFATYFVVLAARYMMMVQGFSMAYILHPEEVEQNLREWRKSIVGDKNEQH